MAERTKRSGLFKTGVATLSGGIFLAVSGLAMAPVSAEEFTEEQTSTCDSALQGDPDAQLGFATDPAAGAEVVVGDEIDVTLTWAADVWQEIDKLAICMYVDDVLTALHWQKPGVDDGTESATFVVPEGAEEVCVNGRISGNPDEGNETDSTHKTAQACFEVVTEDTTTTEEETTTTTVASTTTSETVLGTVVTQPPASSTSETVLGAVVSRQLPRTGTGTTVMLLTSASLMALGLALVASAKLREQRV